PEVVGQRLGDPGDEARRGEARGEDGEPGLVRVDADVGESTGRGTGDEVLEVASLPYPDVEHAPGELGQEGAHPGVVAAEDVGGDPLPAAGALGAPRAGGRLRARLELAEVAGEVVGGELGGDVGVDLAEAIAGDGELVVGEVGGGGADEAHAVAQADHERSGAFGAGPAVADEGARARGAGDV